MIALSPFCPPGEVPAKLLVRQCLIGRVVTNHIPMERTVIFVICQQFGLLQKNRFSGLPLVSGAVFQRAGSTKEGRQFLCWGFLPGFDGFIFEDLVIEPLCCVFHSVVIQHAALLSLICSL